MEKKYLIWPDWVMSRTDGERHFISASRLIHLYGVNPDECHIHRENGERDPIGLLVLAPKRDGDYTLPKT